MVILFPALNGEEGYPNRIETLSTPEPAPSKFLVPNNPLELLERSELQKERSELQKHSSGKLGPKVSSASQRDDKRHGAQLTRQEHKTERIPLLV